MVPTPELDRLALISDKSQAIGDFLEWSRMTLCKPHEHEPECYAGAQRPQCGLAEGEFVPVMRPIRKLLAEYFDIDEQKCEDEKRAILDELQGRLVVKEMKPGAA